MKKLITRFSALAVGLALSAGIAAQPVKLAANAPDSYTVVKGDTLWDIAGRFLDKPWRWSEIWELNRSEIKDPHWIYPGDVIYLDYSGDRPRLRVGRTVQGTPAAGQGYGANGQLAAGGDGKLRPMVRSHPLDDDAIPTIDIAAIESFLNRPLIVDEEGLASSPRIVATQEGRVYLGRGDKAYVRGVQEGAEKDWHVYRQARPLLDPDTRKPIAYEALYVGSARLTKTGDPSTFEIYNTSEEVGVGDRLMPADETRFFNIAPHAPASDIKGRIVSVNRGVSQVGKNSVIAINRGTLDGVDVGAVLDIALLGRTIVDRETREAVRLPDETVGQVMVFRVFDHIAYGLVVEAKQSINVGDTVTSP